MTSITIHLDDSLADWLQQTSQVQRRAPGEIIQTALRRQRALAEWDILKKELKPMGEFAHLSEDEAMQIAIDTIKEVREEARQERILPPGGSH